MKTGITSTRTERNGVVYVETWDWSRNRHEMHIEGGAVLVDEPIEQYEQIEMEL